VLVLIVEVVAPVLQRKVEATPAAPNADGAAPKLGVAVSVAGSVLAQTSGLLTETVGFGLIVRQPEPVPEHPFESVTVTE
jgi:hypothetical protein